MARVSVILPTYNHADYLAAAMESILRQTYTDFELVVIDDGSSDNTSEVLAQFNDSRLKIIRHQKNLGLVATLNEALAKCQHEFIARMDADDVSTRNRLRKQVDFLDANPTVSMCGTRMKELGGWRKFKCPSDPETIKTQLLVNNVISHSSVMWRRDYFAKNKLRYDEKFVGIEDYELWTRVSAVGQIANLPEYLDLCRFHQNRITVKQGRVQASNFAKVIEREILKCWGQLKKISWQKIFDLGQIKNATDLKMVDGGLLAILAANKKKQCYQNNLLKQVLAEKFLVCASVAAAQKNNRRQGREIWKIWQDSLWKELYCGEHKRQWRLWQKCFIK